MKATTPTRVNHPGLTVQDFLEDRGRSQKYLALLIGKSPVEVNYIIKGTKDINADFAIRFGIVFGTSAEVWSNLQKRYDIYKTEQSQKKHEYVLIKQRVKELAFA